MLYKLSRIKLVPPVYAGIQKRAPKFIREAGLEWFYRLVQEPQRLWKRYSTTMPVFVWLVAKQLFGEFENSGSALDMKRERK